MTERTNQIPQHSVDTADPRDQPAAAETPEKGHAVDATRQWDSGELPVADYDEDPTARIRPVREARQGISYDIKPAPARGPRLQAFLGASTGVWIGLALVASGFVAIFYSWGKVAGLVNVAQQMPYLVSGGITGLALVIVGATVVDVAVRRQDSHERTHQLAQINRTLAELHDLLESDEVLAGDQEWEEEQ